MSSMKSWGLFLVKGKLSPHIVNVVGAIKFFFFNNGNNRGGKVPIGTMHSVNPPHIFQIVGVLNLSKIGGNEVVCKFLLEKGGGGGLRQEMGSCHIILRVF